MSSARSLCTAALEIRDWDEAVVKLNRLILRRTARVGRPAISVCINSITPEDLSHLKSWCRKEPYVESNDPEGVVPQLSALTDLDFARRLPFR